MGTVPVGAACLYVDKQGGLSQALSRGAVTLLAPKDAQVRTASVKQNIPTCRALLHVDSLTQLCVEQVANEVGQPLLLLLVWKDQQTAP